MKLTSFKIAFTSLALAATLFSCSVVTETISLETPAQTFNISDIFEGGGNSATQELNIKELLESNPMITKEKMEEAILSSVTISKTDSAGLSAVRGAKLSFSSDDLPMVAVANKNDITGADKELTLDILDDTEIAEYLNPDVIYVTLDIDYTADQDETQVVSASIKFDVEVEAEAKE
jgi:hypothetical protein